MRDLQTGRDAVPSKILRRRNRIELEWSPDWNCDHILGDDVAQIDCGIKSLVDNIVTLGANTRVGSRRKASPIR
jgi:hypothetical protein